MVAFWRRKLDGGLVNKHLQIIVWWRKNSVWWRNIIVWWRKNSVWWLSGRAKTGWWPCKETPAKRKIFVGWRTFRKGGFLAGRKLTGGLVKKHPHTGRLLIGGKIRYGGFLAG